MTADGRTTTSRTRITAVVSPCDLKAVTRLFHGYAASLPVDLAYQHFASEVAALPGEYIPPLGALLLARDEDGTALGCVGLRALGEDGLCEMKRLYLLPEARGHGVGRALADAVVAEARRAGHREMRLDTLRSMTTAIAMYRDLGFRRIAPYYGPTPPGTIFMALNL